MLKALSRSLFQSSAPARRGKQGARAYAVGDIHGRLDLLDSLLAQIQEDNASRDPAKTYVVFLGDLIDRGPDSAGVVERLLGYRPDFASPIFLAGNHEEILLRVIAGEHGILRDWLSFGGAECVASYGLDPRALAKREPAAAARQVLEAIPPSHIQFLESFADTFRFGDYLFVHAGIRPGVALADQVQFDLRWIRDPFLNEGEEHGMMIVHGHTISPKIDERSNRIGIDTGAYRSGILTAVGIEGAERWYISTAPVNTEERERHRRGSKRR